MLAVPDQGEPVGLAHGLRVCPAVIALLYRVQGMVPVRLAAYVDVNKGRVAVLREEAAPMPHASAVDPLGSADRHGQADSPSRFNERGDGTSEMKGGA